MRPIVLLTLVGIAASAGAQTTYHWIGPDSGSWQGRSNWAPTGIPGAGDSAVFVAPARQIVVSLDSEVSVAGLVVSGGMSRELTNVRVVSDGANLTDIGRVGITGGSLRLEVEAGPIQRLNVGQRGSVALEPATRVESTVWSSASTELPPVLAGLSLGYVQVLRGALTIDSPIGGILDISTAEGSWLTLQGPHAHVGRLHVLGSLEIGADIDTLRAGLMTLGANHPATYDLGTVALHLDQSLILQGSTCRAAEVVTGGGLSLGPGEEIHARVVRIGGNLTNWGAIAADSLFVAGDADGSVGTYRIGEEAVFQGRFRAGVQAARPVIVGDGSSRVWLRSRSVLFGYFLGVDLAVEHRLTWFWYGPPSSIDASGGGLSIGPEGGVAFYHTVPQEPHALGDFRIESAGNVAFGALNQRLDFDGPFVSGDSTSFSLFASDSTRVKVTADSLALGGRLLVYSSATMQVGARFVLFSAPRRSGTFASATLPSLPTGQEWQITYPPGEVVLTVVSATESAERDPPSMMFVGPSPNPNDGTGFVYLTTPRPSHATISVHDALGRSVAVLLDRWVSAGTHQLSLAALRLSAGAYVARIEVDDEVITRRFVIAR